MRERERETGRGRERERERETVRLCVDVVARPLLIWLTENAAVCVSAFTLELFTPQSCCTGESAREGEREVETHRER